MKELLLAPISWLYGACVNLRHRFFDWGILKTEEFDIPIVCVGNIAVGGTGKTPHTEYLISVLSRTHNVGVISRGYKRTTKGFMLADADSSYRQIGDEPKQIKQKFPHIPLAVCEKRSQGIKELRRLHPEINLIILDDAFQHRYVEAWVNVVLVDYNKPLHEDHFLPLGTLRDSKSQIKRANFVVVTKCPDNIKPIDLRVTSKYLNLMPFQCLYFSKFKNDKLVPVFSTENPIVPRSGANVIVMTGIAKPQIFYNHIAKEYKIIEKLKFPDHYSYKIKDIKQLEALLKRSPKDTLVVVTEKDAVKLTNRKKIPEDIQRRLYYSPIKVEFLNNKDEEFCRQIELYAKQNQKYCMLHPE